MRARLPLRFVGMAPADLQAQLAEVGALLGARVDELAARVANAIRTEVDFYGHTTVVPDDVLVADTAANLRFVFAALQAGDAFDTSPAVNTGAKRAAAGVPLPAVMDAFRVAAHELWGVMIELAGRTPGVGAPALLRATELFWQAQDHYTTAMTSAYRQQAMNQALEDEAERAALAEALLEGRLSGAHSLWEVAQMLRIPAHGPYVVMAADAPKLGKQALPGVVAMLRSIGVYSAWRLLPDVQIGIAQIPSRTAHTKLVELLQRISTTKIGISPKFDNLADTSQQLRFARHALDAHPTGNSKVTVFDDSVLGVAAVSMPEVGARLSEAVLGGFADLPDAERDVLFETFRTWVDEDGSVQRAAELLVCHPNTVRYRLRRIEERTHRSLSAPRDLAELCLMFEVRNRTS